MRNLIQSAVVAASLVAIGGVSSSALAETIIYQSNSPTGFFAPINSSTPAGTKFGDSGWVGSGGSPAVLGVNSITLGLAVVNNLPAGTVNAGTTDINFTFNNGDPSGLVFGNGAQLYSTTINGVSLPELPAPGDRIYFNLRIDLPALTLAPGFNNFGWSVGVSNYAYDGNFGFQNSGLFNPSFGFITGNASQFNPSSGTWSLFAFGPAFPDDSANFVATLTVPEPATLGGLAAASLIALRRRAR